MGFSDVLFRPHRNKIPPSRRMSVIDGTEVFAILRLDNVISHIDMGVDRVVKETELRELS
jgi:hypothetical protein